MNVWIVRTMSSLDYEGSPDVAGVFESKERAELYCFSQAWIYREKSQDFELDQYTTAEIEEWEVK